MTEVAATEQAPRERRPPTVHFPCFDGLRAIAASAVFLTHAGFISGFNVRSDVLGPYVARGDIGVAIFFLISGFLLYRPFVARHFEDRPGPALRPYLRRRFLRIFPAYWVALTFVLFVVPRPDFEGGVAEGLPSSGGLVLRYLLLHVYHPDHVLGPLQQSWTLSIEIAFYVFLPLYAAVIARGRLRTASDRLRRELAGLVALYAVSVATRVTVLVIGTRYNGMINTWLPTQLDYFALGMGLALASVWTRDVRGATGTQPRRSLLDHPALPATSWLLAACCFYLVSRRIGLPPGPVGPDLADFEPHQQLLRQLLYGLTAFFLLVPAVFGPQRRSAVRRALQLRVVVWIGLVSYGIYLWHEAMMDWFMVLDDVTVPFTVDFGALVLFAAATTIAVAAASYWIVEKPALRLKDRRLAPALRRVRRVGSSPGRP